MALMTVLNEGNGDFRSKPRWSANRKMDVVLRLLRGEKLEELSRGARRRGPSPRRLARRIPRGWQDGAAGKDQLLQRAEDRALREAERKIGELTMENEISEAGRPKKGGLRSRHSPGRGERRDGVPLAARLRGLGAARSTIYHRKVPRGRPTGVAGARTEVGDEALRV